jgi:hypothetical protein
MAIWSVKEGDPRGDLAFDTADEVNIDDVSTAGDDVISDDVTAVA